VNAFTLTLGTIASTVALFAVGIPFLDLMELRTYDLRFLSRGPQDATPAVVIAAIDEKSLDAEGRWPWPRARIAKLVDILSEGGAAAIVFDMVFAEADDGDNDRALAESIDRSVAPVVLGYFFHEDRKDRRYEIESAEIERQLELISSSMYRFVVYRNPETEHPNVELSYAPEGNLAILAEAADSSGFFSLRQDRDGIIRRVPLAIRGGDEVFPPLSILAAWHAMGAPQLTLKVDPYGGVEGIQIGGFWVPTDERGGLLINYRGPPGETFAEVSVSDILSGEIPPDAFQGRIVLVGVTATGIFDVRSTPFRTVHPGVEIHANVIDNILTGEIITKPAWSQVFDLIAIVLLAGLVGIVVPRLHAVAALLFAVALFGLHILVARQLFVEMQVWLNIVYPVLALGGNYTALTLLGYVSEERERRKMRRAFGQYVSSVVIDEMLKDPGALKLGGEEKVLTVLFSDLQGFTAYTERYPPQTVIEFLSEYYGRMTECIYEHGGMLKEYVGDELMAIFGAPLEQADHATRACDAALAMRVLRHALSEEWQRTGRPPLFARTGINSGPMLVGNLGSEYRFSYGVLGDNVNLGSRLEGQGKTYGTEILIGENTAKLIGEGFALREVDVVQVVGRTQPTRVYELLAGRGAALPVEQERALRSYAAGLEAYRAQRFVEAEKLFGEALSLQPEDGPSKTMLGRCTAFRQSPPPEDWNGVYEATQK
jgi:adenylate cyclase